LVRFDTGAKSASGSKSPGKERNHLRPAEDRLRGGGFGQELAGIDPVEGDLSLLLKLAALFPG